MFLVIGFFFAIGYLQDGMEPVFRVVWGFWLAYWLYTGFRFTRIRVDAGAGGIHVVNMFTSFDLRWEEIAGFRVGRWKLLPAVCRIELRNGQTKIGFGIQEATNFPTGSAERMAEKLSDQLRARGMASASARSAPPRTTSPSAPS